MLALIAAGWSGSRDPLYNPLPLVVWTLIWVGLTLLQSVFGDLWACLNPWTGVFRLIDKGRGPAARRDWSAERLGYWPAVVQLFGFAWFELIDPAPDDPARLAVAVAVYFTVNLAAMLVFGGERWRLRGECLSVFFAMVARLSMFARDERSGVVGLCLPAAKLATAEPLPPSGAAFLLLALASVSFDGLARTFAWLGFIGVNPLEFPGRSALVGSGTAGLAATFLGFAALFGARWPPAGGWPGTASAPRRRQGCSSGRSCRSRSPTISHTI